MTEKLTKVLLIASTGLLCAVPSYPQAPAAGRVQTIDERTAGMRKIDGYFPMYWDDRTGNLFLEISRFDSDLLFTTGLAAGLGSNDIGFDRGRDNSCRGIAGRVRPGDPQLP